MPHFGSQLEDAVHLGGKAGQGQRVADYMPPPPGRKQRLMDAGAQLALSSLSSPGPQPMG